MRQPEIYNAKQIQAWDCDVEINGKFYPARPIGSNMRSFMWRWHLAWLVLTGKIDALTWGGGQ